MAATRRASKRRATERVVKAAAQPRRVSLEEMPICAKADRPDVDEAENGCLIYVTIKKNAPAGPKHVREHEEPMVAASPSAVSQLALARGPGRPTKKKCKKELAPAIIADGIADSRRLIDDFSGDASNNDDAPAAAAAVESRFQSKRCHPDNHKSCHVAHTMGTPDDIAPQDDAPKCSADDYTARCTPYYREETTGHVGNRHHVCGVRVRDAKRPRVLEGSRSDDAPEVSMPEARKDDHDDDAHVRAAASAPSASNKYEKAPSKHDKISSSPSLPQVELPPLPGALLDDLRDQFGALLRQERDPDYNCAGLFSLSPESSPPPHEPHGQGKTTYGPDAAKPSSSQTSNQYDDSSSSSHYKQRSKMCEWAYQVVDHYNIDREIVSIFVSYLDRIALRLDIADKASYEYATLTCLYLATKLYDSQEKLSVSSFVKLAKSSVTADEITAVETAFLNALSWRVHPPTAMAFVRLLWRLVPVDSPASTKLKHGMIEVSRFLTELSVFNTTCSTECKPSSVALAAVLNTLSHFGNINKYLSDGAIRQFQVRVWMVMSLDCIHDDEVTECRAALHDLFKSQDGV